MAVEIEHASLLGESGGEEGAFGDQVITERRNLLNVCKLVIKQLIESSMTRGQPMDDSNVRLQQLFLAVEHCLRHRLRARRNFMGQKRSFWSVIESCEKTSSEFMETVLNTRSVTGIKTTMGRARAWIRVSLMEKKLADHFKTLSENKHIIGEWYEHNAFILSEECSTVISGLLMGLNVIDYSVSAKGEEFDRPCGVLNLSPFLKDGNYLERAPEEGETELTEDEKSVQLAQLLDQKAYLEELNKKLEKQLERTQSQLQSTESENDSMREQLGSMIGSVEELTTEKNQLREDKDRTEVELKKKLEVASDDKKMEIDTYVQSRAGLNDLYAASQKNLDVERNLRQQLEQELESMKRLKEEKEIALQLLEKSVHEKQDTIVKLRKQLEELKSANLKAKSQLKISSETHQGDSTTIKTLEGKVNLLSSENKQLEQQLQETRSCLRESEKTSKEIGSKLADIQLARSTAESDLAIEKQWRTTLQAELQKEKDRVVELTNETKKFKSLKEEHSQLHEKYACLQESVSEQEIALVEMGRQLSLSQQKIADMKQVSQIMKENVWKDDKEITECQHCQSAFNVAKRKHHCRNCGGVFCANCSDNTMQLASSAKPVRVCDACYTLLLERASK